MPQLLLSAAVAAGAIGCASANDNEQKMLGEMSRDIDRMTSDGSWQRLANAEQPAPPSSSSAPSAQPPPAPAPMPTPPLPVVHVHPPDPVETADALPEPALHLTNASLSKTR